MKGSAARVLGVLALLCLSLPLHAQTTGAIRGTIETGGTPLPGVTVEARSPNLQGSRSSVTDGDGRYNLTLLPPGTYTVTASLQGFAPIAKTLQLSLGQIAALNIELIQAQAEEVTVTAQAVSVETETNTVGRTLDASQFQALPTGRNYASVAQLSSGI